VAFHEAATDEFAAYARDVVDNAAALAEQMLARGFSLVTGGTDNHLMLVDLTNRDISGRKAAHALNRCGIELNANSIPFDPRKPFDPSGVRIGTAALTSRGMKTAEMAAVADLLDRGVREAARTGGEPSDEFCTKLRTEVRELVTPFPAPGL
jgi:glycine hydroxymethyltransferase